MDHRTGLEEAVGQIEATVLGLEEEEREEEEEQVWEVWQTAASLDECSEGLCDGG